MAGGAGGVTQRSCKAGPLRRVSEPAPISAPRTFYPKEAVTRKLRKPSELTPEVEWLWNGAVARR